MFECVAMGFYCITCTKLLYLLFLFHCVMHHIQRDLWDAKFHNPKTTLLCVRQCKRQQCGVPHSSGQTLAQTCHFSTWSTSLMALRIIFLICKMQIMALIIYIGFWWEVICVKHLVHSRHLINHSYNNNTYQYCIIQWRPIIEKKRHILPMLCQDSVWYTTHV